MLDSKDYQEIARLMKTVIESDVTPKFQMLAEQQEAIMDKLPPRSRIDELEEEVRFLKSIVKLHSDQLAELRKAE